MDVAITKEEFKKLDEMPRNNEFYKKFCWGTVERSEPGTYKMILKVYCHPVFKQMLANEYSRLMPTYEEKYSRFEELEKQHDGMILDMFDDGAKAIEDRTFNWLILNPRKLEEKKDENGNHLMEFVGLYSDDEVTFWVSDKMEKARKEIVDRQFEAIRQLVFEEVTV